MRKVAYEATIPVFVVCRTNVENWLGKLLKVMLGDFLTFYY